MGTRGLMIAQLAATVALLAPTARTEPEQREPLRDDLPPRDPPAPPPPKDDMGPITPAVLQALRRRYEAPKPPGHNGKRAMERRLRQQQRAAEKAARKQSPD